MFRARVWNGVQWSCSRFCVFGKEQESDGRKESKEYHVHGVSGHQGVIARSAGVVIVGVAGGCGRARTVELVGNARLARNYGQMPKVRHVPKV